MSSRRGDGYRDDREERVRYDDRYVEREVEFRRSRPPPAVLERDREEIRIREDARVPAYLQEGPRRGPGGPMVLRAREVEDFEFASRRRSPSPERKVERESITIRRDREESRPPPPPPPPQEREREEIIIRREEVDDDTRSRRSYRPREYEREEIIIKRDESEAPPPRRSDYGLQRPRSRERSTVRRDRRGSESEDEIIIRREEREGRRGERDREEIIIRHRSRSRSSSPAPSAAPPEPRIINAPPIHQEIITHHRHIDHGYEIATPARVVVRPPSPPSPPPEKSKERISIHRSGERDGRAYHDDVTIDRVEGGHGPPRAKLNNELARPPARAPQRTWSEEIDEEAEYYDSIAKRRSHPGEAYHGYTRDWELVDVPPGTNRVRMDGVGGASQEITWQRYNGARRSKFYPDGEEDVYASYEVEREPRPLPRREPSPEPERPAEIGGRYGRARNPTDRLWTEVTKDLVVKEAIQEMGYEFEETDEFYYIIAYLKYEDMTRLVGLSEDIRKDRRKRVKEMEWENRLAPEPEEEPKKPLGIEAPPPPRSKSPWNTEDERYIEREIIYRGGRPPPPPGWRR